MEIKRDIRPVYYKGWGTEINVSGRKVSGYLASFNTKDNDKDVILKGAFAKSINERGVNSNTSRKIAYLWQHDMHNPIGRFTELKEDDYGLYFEAEVDNIPLGDRVLEQYKSGTLNQHSIGFQYVKDKIDYSEKEDSFFVKEVNLFEGSVVTMGCNENTPFLGMKSDFIETESAILKRDTEKFLKSLPANMEYEARQLIAKHIALAESNEPLKNTLKSVEPPFIEQKADMMEAINNFKINI